MAAIEPPNFQNLKLHLRGAATEIGRCTNLPAIQVVDDVAAIRRDVAEIRRDVSTLTETVTTLARTVATLSTDVATLKTDVATLKTDVTTLKTDVTTLKTDVATLNETVPTLATAESVTALTRTVEATEARLRQDIQETKLSMRDFDFNNRARLDNNVAVESDRRIYPLKNTDTHQLVEIPETRAQLDRISAERALEYLGLLGQNVAPRSNKLTELKRFLGIRV